MTTNDSPRGGSRSSHNGPSDAGASAVPPQGAPGKGEVEESIKALKHSAAVASHRADNGNYQCAVTINEAEKYADLLARQQARIEELEGKMPRSVDPDSLPTEHEIYRRLESALSDGGGRVGEDE